MKLSKAEYEELIRKKPSLRPTEVVVTPNIGGAIAKAYGDSLAIKSQNTHNTFVEGFKERLGEFGRSQSLEQEKPLKTPRTLKFTIPGQPVGKPRQTQSDRWKKRPCVMRYRAWADKARASVPPGVSLGVYRQIAFIAYLEFPKSYSVTKRAWLTGQPHLHKPDIDNIAKSCGDALFPEDKFIWKVSGEKRWEDGAGARIEVELK